MSKINRIKSKHCDTGKILVKISSTPNTWLELDSSLTDTEIEDKIKRFKQLTDIK